MSLFHKAVVVWVTLGASAALPCGPDFPLEFLSHRARTLATMPDGLFDLEAERLVPPPEHRFKAWPLHEVDAGVGGALEPEEALYRKGAAAWNANRFEEAEKHFEAVLALPEAQRKRFTIPAEFMTVLYDDNEPDRQLATYRRIRAQAVAGFSDEKALAAATLGYQARRSLGVDDPKAIALYAEQAAHGSQSGRVSLLLVARQLARDLPRLRKAINDPLTQRLMSMYLWTRSSEDWWGTSESNPSALTVLMELAKLPSISGAAHLSAALFRAGRFEEAETFAKMEDTPVAHWVRAKLALRRGASDVADRELEIASNGLTNEEDWGAINDARPRQQIEVERAILALSHDDFDSAMKHVLTSCSWEDVAWVAERVIDVDSLKKTVDGLPSKDECRRVDPDPEDVDRWYSLWFPQDQHAALREVLARRLMREKRMTEALAYFGPEMLEPAKHYVAALNRADTSSDRLVQAAALAEAAQLARRHGVRLLGTESAPDYVWTGAYWDPGTYFGYESPPFDAGPSHGRTAAENARADSSAPKPDRRYHWRWAASALAEESANRLSKRSQAFVAMLCTSARYVMDSDPERAQYLFRRWIHEGPLLKEDMIFGRTCPTPRFVEPPEPKKKPIRKRTMAAVAGSVVSGLVLLAVVIRRRRR